MISYSNGSISQQLRVSLWQINARLTLWESSTDTTRDHFHNPNMRQNAWRQYRRHIIQGNYCRVQSWTQNSPKNGGLSSSNMFQRVLCCRDSEPIGKPPWLESPEAWIPESCPGWRLQDISSRHSTTAKIMAKLAKQWLHNTNMFGSTGSTVMISNEGQYIASCCWLLHGPSSAHHQQQIRNPSTGTHRSIHLELLVLG